MCGDGINSVSVVLGVLDLEAAAASDLVALHSSEELSGLAREHRPDYQLDSPLQLGERLMLRAVRSPVAVVGLALIGGLRG